MSDAVRPSGVAPHGTSLLPADLTEVQMDAAPVLGSIDELLIEELSQDEDDAFAAAQCSTDRGLRWHGLGRWWGRARSL